MLFFQPYQNECLFVCLFVLNDSPNHATDRNIMFLKSFTFTPTQANVRIKFQFNDQKVINYPISDKLGQLVIIVAITELINESLSQQLVAWLINI